MLAQQIDQDLKKAMLAREADTVSILRQIKSVLQYEAVALHVQKDGLNDEQIVKVLSKESKKRQEAAELYEKVGETTRQQNELSEKAVIDGYLPKQMDEADVQAVVDEVVASNPGAEQKDMGKLIGEVRAKTAGQADGALIAKLIKDKLGN